MNSNNLAALVLATGLWIGLAAWVMGGSTRPRRGVLDEHKFRQSREPSDAGPRQLSSSGSLCLSGYRRDRDPLTKDLRPCRFRQGRSRDEKRVDIAPSPVRSLGRAQGSRGRACAATASARCRGCGLNGVRPHRRRRATPSLR